MTQPTSDAPFDRVRALFETCVELPPDARDARLAAADAPVAARVRALLSIADREAGADRERTWTRTLDAQGRGLVLVDDAHERALKLFRIRADDAERARAILADRPARSRRVADAAVVPQLDGGVAPGGIAWFTTPFVADAVALPDALQGAEPRARAGLARALTRLIVAAADAGIPDPWPGPRQVLVTPDGALRVTDLGVSAAFAVDPECGRVRGVDAAPRALLATFGIDADGRAVRTVDAFAESLSAHASDPR